MKVVLEAGYRKRILFAPLEEGFRWLGNARVGTTCWGLNSAYSIPREWTDGFGDNFLGFGLAGFALHDRQCVLGLALVSIVVVRLGRLKTMRRWRYRRYLQWKRFSCTALGLV